MLQETQYVTGMNDWQPCPIFFFFYKRFTIIPLVCMWRLFGRLWLAVHSLIVLPPLHCLGPCLIFLCLSPVTSSFLILFLLFTSIDDILWGIYYEHKAAESNFTHLMKLYETFHSIFSIWPFHRRVHLCWLLATPQRAPIPASFTVQKVLTDIKKKKKLLDGEHCHQFSLKWSELKRLAISHPHDRITYLDITN